MKLEDFKDLAIASNARLQELYNKNQLLTLNMDKHIANYLKYENPEFITILRQVIDSYKWAKLKKGQGKELSIEEHILIGNVTEVTTNTKSKEKATKPQTVYAHSINMVINSADKLKRKRAAEDNIEKSEARKREESITIRLAEMSLNESEIEILEEDKSANA
ncbi:27305_t:CDS:1 [Dentiscutata erythropus]|uniref:27305_t:CDS:1 n=1 Tax=Dentiscutata erythropus TaxID=1348616 RepID=A0A9N8ZHT7_9GLOM|nr:27305_t:CDS:1 [Dentiscutata erythropus]